MSSTPKLSSHWRTGSAAPWTGATGRSQSPAAGIPATSWPASAICWSRCLAAGHQDGLETSAAIPITITRTKPGPLCSMVTEKTPVDYGVVILAGHNVTVRPFVVSTFAGRVTRPTADKRIDALEGKTVPASPLHRLLGALMILETSTHRMNR